jgi:hypothetical protein
VVPSIADCQRIVADGTSADAQLTAYVGSNEQLDAVFARIMRTTSEDSTTNSELVL